MLLEQLDDINDIISLEEYVEQNAGSSLASVEDTQDEYWRIYGDDGYSDY